MNQTELLKLRDDLVCKFRTGATTDDIEEWADAYSFDRRNLVELVRLLLCPDDPPPGGEEPGCEFCRQSYNRPNDAFTCPYCQARWIGARFDAIDA